MADNVPVTPGAGAVISTDELPDGSQAQRVKLVLGGDGVDGGNVSTTNPMPVTGTALGDPADAAAGSDSATTGLIGLVKRLLSKLPGVGQQVMAASQPVAIASDQTTVPVNQSGVSASGSLTGVGQAVTLALNGATGCAFDLRGTFSGTVTFEGSIDGTNFFTLACVPAGGAPQVANVTTATTQGAWSGNANGMVQVRARCSAYTSGTITVTVRAMQAAGIVSVYPTGNTSQSVSISGTPAVTINGGTNAIGDVGTQYRANATGAATPFSLLSPATPAATAVKASAGRLLGMVLTNTGASLRSVKFWNTAVAGVTLGTTAALFEIDIPAGGVVEWHMEGGIAFGTAITVAVTGAKGLTDNTAITLNDVSGVLMYA